MGKLRFVRLPIVFSYVTFSCLLFCHSGWLLSQLKCTRNLFMGRHGMGFLVPRNDKKAALGLTTSNLSLKLNNNKNPKKQLWNCSKN